MGWLATHDGWELTAVGIAPDLGERYLDTVYQTNWLEDLYGADLLGPNELTHGHRSA
jgi:N-(2-amino-2-carboxyethyl)-L-glutamate synthase